MWNDNMLFNIGKLRLNSVEKYVIKDDKWTFAAPMKEKRHYLSACTINDE